VPSGRQQQGRADLVDADLGPGAAGVVEELGRRARRAKSKQRQDRPLPHRLRDDLAERGRYPLAGRSRHSMLDAMAPVGRGLEVPAVVVAAAAPAQRDATAEEVEFGGVEVLRAEPETSRRRDGSELREAQPGPRGQVVLALPLERHLDRSARVSHDPSSLSLAANSHSGACVAA